MQPILLLIILTRIFFEFIYQFENNEVNPSVLISSYLQKIQKRRCWRFGSCYYYVSMQRQSSGTFSVLEKVLFILFTFLSVIASVLSFTDSSDNSSFSSLVFKIFIVFLTLLIFLYSFIITVLIPVITKNILPKIVDLLNYNINSFRFFSTYRLVSFHYQNFQEIDLSEDIRLEENKDMDGFNNFRRY